MVRKSLLLLGLVLGLAAAIGLWACNDGEPDRPAEGSATSYAKVDMHAGAGTPTARPQLHEVEAPWTPELRACAECHASIVEQWRQNGMADTLGPIEGSVFANHAVSKPEAWTTSPNSGYHYRALERDGHWEIVQARQAPLEGWPAHERRQSLRWRIGAGVQDTSLIASQGGRWFFAPLEWFSNHGWALSPTEHRPRPHGLNRPITAECLGCHATEPLEYRYPLNLWEELEPTGMACATCHGPGEEHIERMKAAPDEFDAATGIKNPAAWPVERQLDLCARCHLQGDARIELAPDTAPRLQPGDDLFARRAVYVAAEAGADFGFVSQVERLALSACFQQSPQMSCTTCHDPHLPSRLQARQAMLDTCASCHVGVHAEDDRLTGKQDCIDCHMRRSQPFDLEHVQIHDHWIRREPPPPRALQAIREVESPQGHLRRFRYRETTQENFSERELAALDGMAQGHLGFNQRAIAAWRGLPEPGTAQAIEAAEGEGPWPVLRLPMFHFLRGRMWQESGDPDRARAAYHDALELDARLAEARINLAWMLAQAGELGQARAHAEYLKQAFPETEVPWNILALVEEKEGRRAEAARALQESIRLNPYQAGAWQTLARFHEQAGRIPMARDGLKRAYDLDPDLPGLMQDIARVAGKM